MKGGKGQRLKGGKPGGKMFLEMEKILNEMQRPAGFNRSRLVFP